MTNKPHNRRSDDKIMALIRLIEFFIEEKKTNLHSEKEFYELRTDIDKLLIDIETVRAVNDRLLKEIASLKEAEIGGLLS